MKPIKILLTAVCALLLASGLVSGPASAQGAVSLETLLGDMIDRDAVARFPKTEFTVKQFSSYDPATTVKDGPGWFANEDFNQFIRLETDRGRNEFVMMDTEDQGPGAIVRFWMTFANRNRGEGILRIYLDGSDTPVIEGTAFGILSGGELADAPLATSVSKLTEYGQRGHNLYLPIPYSKSCKVTYECRETIMRNGKLYPGNENIYYNINYRTYSPATKVVSYSAPELARNEKLLAKVQRQLGENYHDATDMKLSSVSLDADLAPGESKSFTVRGAKAIRQFSLELDAENISQALRSTVIEIAFDGSKRVWVPAGEFFGVSYRRVYTRNWYTSATVDGRMEAFWVMPFARECVITLHNFGEQTVKATGSARYGSWKWDDRSMYFGADWHQYTRISTRVPDTPEGEHLDINFTELRGKGVYLGDGIGIFNTTNSWWGEGDEKIYVDGESFPSHIGTGTEDYFGYAWCMPSVFTDHPFIAQPVGLGSFEPALSINTRFRSLDVIPFNKSLRFDMELWHWAHCIVNYAPVTFWYTMPGGESLITDDMAGVREPVAELKRDVTDRGLQRLEFESENMMVAGSFPSDEVTYQTDSRWSNGAQAFWTGLGVGDKVTLSFRTGAAGMYAASCVFTTAVDYGPVDVCLNGELVARNVDLYTRDVRTKSVPLKPTRLNIGVNTVTFELLAIPAGFDRSVFGFDKLVFEE